MQYDFIWLKKSFNCSRDLYRQWRDMSITISIIVSIDIYMYEWTINQEHVQAYTLIWRSGLGSRWAVLNKKVAIHYCRTISCTNTFM